MPSWLRKLLHTEMKGEINKAVSEALKESRETDGDAAFLSRGINSRLNTRLPVQVIDLKGNVMCTCKVQESKPTQLTLGRLPGELKIPTFEIGQEITLQAHNLDLESVRLSARVVESSIMILIVRNISQVDQVTRRQKPRLPVGRMASLVIPHKGRKDEEIPCTLEDVSITGAAIQTDYELSIGDVVRIRFEVFKDDGVTSCNSQVVWARSKDGSKHTYGLLFEEMDGWKRRYLEQSLRDLTTQLERTVKR